MAKNKGKGKGGVFDKMYNEISDYIKRGVFEVVKDGTKFVLKASGNGLLGQGANNLLTYFTQNEQEMMAELAKDKLLSKEQHATYINSITAVKNSITAVKNQGIMSKNQGIMSKDIQNNIDISNNIYHAITVDHNKEVAALTKEYEKKIQSLTVGFTIIYCTRSKKIKSLKQPPHTTYPHISTLLPRRSSLI